ncbi:HD domain-containing protein [Photobacterium lipolyticum]|uniref:Phosphohydrolase n=1 Tax=Photobacterium lipolyticum TaxID=266810 RepID=A0A2T3MWW1_9GAMM|nr:HD domain-containing protein [Photobacterium lipolyticum]PSW04459.1 phosphohydrolase [Photobacterium lipolyticum]
MNEITQILNFIVEVEKLKSVIRKTRPVGLRRYENSAEHSWHVCLSSLILKDYANDPVDINQVIKMLLIHDLGEIDADDKIIYSSETVENKLNEESGIRRIFAILPQGQADQYLSLWHEFEAGETPESKYARAIDRVPPLLHNLHDNGHSWKKHNIPKEKVFSLNRRRISEGSHQLWDAIEVRLIKAVKDGLLN